MVSPYYFRNKTKHYENWQQYNKAATKIAKKSIFMRESCRARLETKFLNKKLNLHSAIF